MNYNKENLPLEKRELIDTYSKMVLSIEYLFLQNKLFQPIGIELSTVKVNLDVNETNIFSQLVSSNRDTPPGYYRYDTDSIHIFIEHDSFTKRETYEEKFAFLMFLLFHEASHRLFLSNKRQETRDSELWNIATDLEIHNMYYVFNEIINLNSKSFLYEDFKGYCKYINKFLIEKSNTPKELNEGIFEIEYLNYIAEEIYQLLLNSKKEESVTYTFDKNGNLKSQSSSSNDDNNNDNIKYNDDEQSSSEDESDGTDKIKITISTYTLPSGQEIRTTNVDFSNIKIDEKSKEELANEENAKNLRKNILKNALNDEIKKAESRGHISNGCKAFLKKFLHVKIDWGKILRNSLQSALEKSDYFSWSKPRTSLFALPESYYLPSQCSDYVGYGTLIIARDESGSMTEMELAKAAGIILDAKAHYKKIIILKHDTDITEITEIDDINEKIKDILLTRSSIGGTSHKKVFEWIKDYHIKTRDSEDRISCIISITDMYSDIEECQDTIPNNLPKIYLTPTSPEKFPKVKGTIIQVEL